MERKKRVEILLVTSMTLLVLALGFFGYKYYLLNKYNIVVDSAINENIKNLGATFNIKRETNELEFESYKGMNFKSLGKDFVYREEKNSTMGVYDYKTYYLNYKSDVNYDAFFRVAKGLEMYENLINNNYTSYGFTLEDINIKYLFQKYGITNDYELEQYIIKNYNIMDLNLFSNISDIKMNYLISCLANISVINGNIYMLDGNVKGVIYNVASLANRNIFEVHIYGEKDSYVLMFMNYNKDYFNLENIQEFLSNVTIVE